MCVRVNETIDGLREVLSFAFEAAHLLESSRQGEVSRKFAGWAAILAVPTAIAGIYGMNFEFMPELHWRYGYFIVLGADLRCRRHSCSGSSGARAGSDACRSGRGEGRRTGWARPWASPAAGRHCRGAGAGPARERARNRASNSLCKGGQAMRVVARGPTVSRPSVTPIGPV